MKNPFRITRRIEFADTDMAGIVHFSNYFRFMEAAEVEFLRFRGLNVKMHWQDLDIGFPRVSASCDMIRPITFGDLIDIEVSIAKIGTKSITYQFDFFKEGELVARGKVTSVCCRVLPNHQIESIEIPQGYKEKLTK
jgi:YbgC/YbaW family acyl-CoA thioester hydrolase